jgi:chromosome segregation ATPase
MTASARFNASADLAVAVYLEPHAEQRRVLLLGGVDTPLSLHLEGIARHLDVIDPGSREQSRGEVPELPFDDESFDLIVVTDVEALPEPRPDAMRELHRTLARDGLLAVVAPNTGSKAAGSNASSSDQLERLLAAELRYVRVVSETPMFGYALRDVRAEQAALSIDSSLLGKQADRPERALVVAADERFTLEPRLWVQVPAKDVGAADAEVDPRWVESLRKAEDEARRALGREAELLRELSREQKARENAESAKERNKALERKLLAIEADYDDAVARVRYFEGLLLEREAADQNESSQRDQLERKLRSAQDEIGTLQHKLKAVEAEQAQQRAGADAVANDTVEHERRLAELATELGNAQREFKRQEAISRDLLEELRGLEQRALVTVEHDARVAELEAERERAMQRALEAEVARESAQMRVDELRAQLEASHAQSAKAHELAPSPAALPPAPAFDVEAHEQALEAAREAERAPLRAAVEAARDEQERLKQELEALRRYHADELEAQRQLQGDQTAQLHALRGERSGLRLRLQEGEKALASLAQSVGNESSELDTRLAMAEARAQAAIEALGAAELSVKQLRRDLDDARKGGGDAARADELEALLTRAEKRIDSLERELEEADRFAEEHADDVNRLDTLDHELSDTRAKLDSADDELRALQEQVSAQKAALREREAQLTLAHDNVTTARAEGARAVIDTENRAEQLARREMELRAERDDAHAALAEARAILSHLAARVGADTHDLPSIMQALDQQSAPPSMLDALRKALVEAQAARSDAEYQLSRLSLQIEERDQRIRQLEENGHAPALSQRSFEPPEV